MAAGKTAWQAAGKDRWGSRICHARGCFPHVGLFIRYSRKTSPVSTYKVGSVPKPGAACQRVLFRRHPTSTGRMKRFSVAMVI